MQKLKLPEHEAPTGANQTGAEREILTNLAKALNSITTLPKQNGNGKGGLSPYNLAISELDEAGQSPGESGKLKTREQWLREEIRAGRTLMLGIMQWGVTTLAALETILYYIRRDVANNLLHNGVLPENGTVPAGRWFVGTMFVLMIATMFCAMSRYTAKRHISYRKQLLDMEPSFSGITEKATGGRMNLLPYVLYLAFPAVDFMLWFYFRVTSTITIPW